MIKYLITTLTLLLLFGSCSLFYQNDFIATEKIAQIDNETFIYSVYQTGIDNYRVEFKVVFARDTAKFFDYYINDAVYSKEDSFHFNTLNDTLAIIDPRQTGTFYYQSPNGTTIKHTKFQ